MSHWSKNVDRMKTSVFNIAVYLECNILTLIKLHSSCLTTLFRLDNLKMFGNKKKNNRQKSKCNLSTFATFCKICSTDSLLGIKGVLQKQGAGPVIQLLKHMIVWGRNYRSFKNTSSYCQLCRLVRQVSKRLSYSKNGRAVNSASVKLENYFWESLSKLLPCHFTNSEGAKRCKKKQDTVKNCWSLA